MVTRHSLQTRDHSIVNRESPGYSIVNEDIPDQNRSLMELSMEQISEGNSLRLDEKTESQFTERLLLLFDNKFHLNVFIL